MQKCRKVLTFLNLAESLIDMVIYANVNTIEKLVYLVVGVEQMLLSEAHDLR